MITTCFKPKKTRKNCTFLKSFFKKSYFNLFNNKSLIFFDNLIAKELYFSKLCHLWVLEYVFIGKFYICRVLTVKKQAVYSGTHTSVHVRSFLMHHFTFSRLIALARLLGHCIILHTSIHSRLSKTFF